VPRRERRDHDGDAATTRPRDGPVDAGRATAVGDIGEDEMAHLASVVAAHEKRDFVGSLVVPGPGDPRRPTARDGASPPPADSRARRVPVEARAGPEGGDRNQVAGRAFLHQRPICRLRSAERVCTLRGVNSSQRGSPDGGPIPAPAQEASRRRRTLLAARGAVSATALGAYTIAAAIGAFLALFPAALRPVPRGRSATTGTRVAPEASREPLAG
jgi:hypothetical protein